MDSLKSTWLKIGAGVVLLAIAAGVFFIQTRDPNARSDRVQFVCVETGKTYWFKRGEHSMVLPLKNPDTGQETLVPCSKDGDQLIVSNRCRSLVKELTKQKLNKVVDSDSLVVKAPTP